VYAETPHIVKKKRARAHTHGDDTVPVQASLQICEWFPGYLSCLQPGSNTCMPPHKLVSLMT